MAIRIDDTMNTIDGIDILERLAELRMLRESLTCDHCHTALVFDEDTLVDATSGDGCPGDVDGTNENGTHEAEAWPDDVADEYAALVELDNQIDIQQDTFFINADYMGEYAREFARDLHGADSVNGWPGDCIDWDKAVDSLTMDYRLVDFNGCGFYVRA